MSTPARKERAKAPRRPASATHRGCASSVLPTRHNQAPRPGAVRSTVRRPFGPTTTRTSVPVPPLARHPIQVRTGAAVYPTPSPVSALPAGCSTTALSAPASSAPGRHLERRHLQRPWHAPAARHRPRPPGPGRPHCRRPQGRLPHRPGRPNRPPTPRPTSASPPPAGCHTISPASFCTHSPSAHSWAA